MWDNWEMYTADAAIRMRDYSAAKQADKDSHQPLPIELVRHYSAASQLNQVLAGGIAGCTTRFLTQPFDVLKIRFQLQVEPVAATRKKRSKYTSLLQAGRVILQEEGIRGFWKGHNAGQVMSITFVITQFWSYEQLQLMMSTLPFLSEHMYLGTFISGGLAASLASTITMPFDVIRTRLVAQDHGSGYKSIWHGLPMLLRHEGIRGCFRGLAPTVMQNGLVGGNFMFYHQLNDLARILLKVDKSDYLPGWCLLINGGIAGTVSKAAVYPLDLIKKRLQMQGFDSFRRSFGRNQHCDGIVHCAKLTARKEGYMGFYKGMIPTLYKSGLTTALYFSIYDTAKLVLTKYRPVKDPVID